MEERGKREVLPLWAKLISMKEAAVIKRFRTIGTAEGISFLLLLGVAMPLKYMMDIPQAVTYIGWIHGILFVLYCYMVVEAGQTLKWKFGRIFLAFLASLLPFGPFLFDRWFLRKGPSVLEESAK